MKPTSITGIVIRFRSAMSMTLTLCLATMLTANEREWSSANGHYKLKAELMAFNDSSVVLKDEFGKLINVDLSQLSESDQEYVASKDTAPTNTDDQLQTWTGSSGMKIRGRILAYGKKQLTIQRQLGKVLVNDQPFKKLEPLRQRLVLRMLSYLEGTEFDEQVLNKWARTLGADIKTYPLSGVLMELESGDVVGVPFFLFDSNDLKLLEPGWKIWLANEEDEQARAREDLMVQTQAREYQRNQQEQRQIEMMKLDMMARTSGLVKVWQVNLVPINAFNARPIAVMVTANDSATASQMAVNQYPGYQVSSVKRSRRWYPT